MSEKISLPVVESETQTIEQTAELMAQQAEAANSAPEVVEETKPEKKELTLEEQIAVLQQQLREKQQSELDELQELMAAQQAALLETQQRIATLSGGRLGGKTPGVGQQVRHAKPVSEGGNTLQVAKQPGKLTHQPGSQSELITSVVRAQPEGEPFGYTELTKAVNEVARREELKDKRTGLQMQCTPSRVRDHLDYLVGKGLVAKVSEGYMRIA